MTDYAKIITYCVGRYNRAKKKVYKLFWINAFGLACDIRDKEIKREDLPKARVKLRIS